VSHVKVINDVSQGH